MPAYSNDALYTALSDLNLIDEGSLKSALQESEENALPLDEVVVRRDLVNEQSLGKIVGDLVGAPFVHLTEVSIPDNVLHLVPEKVARAQNVIAFSQDTYGLHLAMNDPNNALIVNFLERKTGGPVIKYYTTKRDLERTLPLYAKNVRAAFADIIGQSVQEAKGNKNADPPIIRIVNTLIDYAYQNNASDIHIEPMEEHVLVRFRIDGILHDVVELPHELAPQIVTRVKVMANLRTDEHQEPQDGKIVYRPEQREGSERLDIRVSVATTTKGEKIVMRLLSERARQFGLADLGLKEHDLEKVQRAYENPNGMVLVTGPTGSGKTTTLYSILKLINKRELNIMTIEDPVEYEIEYVNQIQVNPKADITFARGLRSIVRQDPDIILVGEIRDDETADIAVNSSLTGHLVLTSLHTNDAVTTFARLTDMSIEPYLVASTVRAIVAQRLVRKICTRCKVSRELDISEVDEHVRVHLGKEKKLLTYVGKGCPVCNDSGYNGRIGIFEVLEMSDAIRDAVVAKKSASDLMKLAVGSGMTTMLDDGIEKVKEGITTLEELLRVTKES